MGAPRLPTGEPSWAKRGERKKCGGIPSKLWETQTRGAPGDSDSGGPSEGSGGVAIFILLYSGTMGVMELVYIQYLGYWGLMPMWVQVPSPIIFLYLYLRMSPVPTNEIPTFWLRRKNWRDNYSPLYRSFLLKGILT